MKLFVLSSDEMPLIFMKAVSVSAAEILFEDGFDHETYLKRIQNPTFQVREVTLELLMEIAPDEFQITEDTSF